MAIMEWFKINGYNFMYGSLRIDTPIQRLIYVELLAMASISRVRRTVCLSEGVSSPRPMLAGLIGISEDELNKAIDYHCSPEIGRLKINEWGGIEIVKWDKYQSKSYDRVRKHREKNRKEKEGVTVNVTGKSVSCNGREEKRREKKRKEENKYIPKDLELANLFLELIRKHTPKFEPRPSIEKWADGVRLIRERDGFSEDEIAVVFRWSQRDEFWHDKVLSPASFRKKSKTDLVTKFERIKMQMVKKVDNGTGGGKNKRDFTEQESRYGTTV